MFDAFGGGGGITGIALTYDATNIDFYVGDGSAFHVTRWAHGGSVWRDGALWTLVYGIDRSATKCTLTAKQEGQTAITPTTTIGSANLSSVTGNVTLAGDGWRWFAQENITQRYWYGSLYQAGLVVGSATYTEATLP